MLNKLRAIISGLVGCLSLLFWGLVLLGGVIEENVLREIGLTDFMTMCGIAYIMSIILSLFFVSIFENTVRKSLNIVVLFFAYSTYLFPFCVGVCFLYVIF